MPSSRKFRRTAPAKHDLARIGEPTLREWGAAQKKRCLQQIGDKLRTLRDTPGIGTPRDDIDTGLRAHPVESRSVREGLDLLKRTEEQRELRMERLRAAIREGDAALAQGEATDLNSDEELDALFAKL